MKTLTLGITLAAALLLCLAGCESTGQRAEGKQGGMSKCPMCNKAVMCGDTMVKCKGCDMEAKACDMTMKCPKCGGMAECKTMMKHCGKCDKMVMTKDAMECPKCDAKMSAKNMMCKMCCKPKT